LKNVTVIHILKNSDGKNKFLSGHNKKDVVLSQRKISYYVM